MKKYRQYITISILVLVLAGWAGRRYFRNLFPTRLKFKQTELVMDGNRKTTINDFKGTVLIVCCFQTWCVDCARETPVLNQLAANIHSPAFKIIYVTDEDSTKVNAFKNRFPSNNISFAYAATKLAELGIHYFPTAFLLDKKGEVIKTSLEGHNWLEQEATIKELIAE